ncbi:MAG: outer membrane lipoprotein-sorting protein [Pseudomonadota bacterium]|nr:outer membrane lipoprotein-sorting protein [Pseudomonadota bacterium]
MRNLLFFLLFLSTSASGLDGANILRQIDENMWPGSYEMYRKLINVKSDGAKREYVMFTLKKGKGKVVNLFLKPPEEHGRVILRVGENMWLKIPDVEQALRVSSMHSVVGGIFNNWDLMLSGFSPDYDVQLAQKEGDVYALTLKAKSKWAVYDTLRLRAGIEDLLLRKVEAYATSNILLKTLTFSEVKDFGNGVIHPAKLETTSPLWPGVKAIMLFGEIRKRELSDEVFTVNWMSKIDDLRQ